MPEVSGAFHLPFDYQIAALRLRLGNLVPTSRYDDLRWEQHDRGFMVAGAMKADLLADLAKAVDKAVSAGTSLEEFRRDFRRIVAERGWHGWTGEGTRAGEAWRTRVIYRTNISTSYAAGRWAQLKDAGFDYWVYRHSGAEHPRLDHLSWDRVVLPADHPFWAQHYPPNGWGCGCRVAGARTRDGARRVGGDPDKDLPENWQSIDPRTGAPVGIGKGWDYAPGRSVESLIRSTLDKTTSWPAPLGAAAVDALARSRMDERVADFRTFVDSTLTGNGPKGQFMVIGAFKPGWLDELARHDLVPVTAEIAVRDRDVMHALRDTKTAPVSLAWYRDLPRHVDQPDEVRLELAESPDQRPVLVLIFNGPDVHHKLIVRIDYRVKKVGTMNIVRTATLATADSLAADRGRSIWIAGRS